MVYVAPDHVDAVWARVAEMVRAGELGPLAKAATAWAPPGRPDPRDHHVMIVYAADWRDIADVRRILRALRAAGIGTEWLHFKRNLETESSAYLKLGRRGVSVWNATPGGDVISTKWVTGERLIVTEENAVEVVATIAAGDAEVPERPDLLARRIDDSAGPPPPSLA